MLCATKAFSNKDSQPTATTVPAQGSALREFYYSACWPFFRLAVNTSAMPFHGPYDVDWICDASAGAHVANNRDWFSNYTDYRSLARTPIDKYPLRVHGIGDVELEVRTNATGNDGQAFHSVILRNVLYIPTCETNIVSETYLGVKGWSYGAKPYVIDEHDRTLLLDDPTAPHKLWLVGQRRGQTSIDVELEYDIGVNWPMEERKK